MAERERWRAAVGAPHASIRARTIALCASALLAIGPPTLARAQGADPDGTMPLGPAASEPEFVAQDDADLRAPFTTERVRALNAIVRRSLAAIDAYDREIDAVRASVRAATAPEVRPAIRADRTDALARLDALVRDAALALSELHASEARMSSSGEPHNETVLAGMRTFVTSVYDELHRARRTLPATRPDTATAEAGAR